jgi:hypothetical protein
VSFPDEPAEALELDPAPAKSPSRRSFNCMGLPMDGPEHALASVCAQGATRGIWTQNRCSFRLIPSEFSEGFENLGRAHFRASLDPFGAPKSPSLKISPAAANPPSNSGAEDPILQQYTTSTPALFSLGTRDFQLPVLRPLNPATTCQYLENRGIRVVLRERGKTGFVCSYIVISLKNRHCRNRLP